MNQKRRVFIAEDDDVLRRHLRLLLEGEGYCVIEQANVTSAKDFLYQDSQFSAFVIDWSLPDGDGTEIISIIRDAGILNPVVFLTARASVADRVLGLRMGATDYIVKPFEPLELIVRLDRHITTFEKLNEKPQTSQSQAGDITVDAMRHQAYWRGQPVELTRLQYNCLLFMMRTPDQVFTRDDLLNAVWGLDKYPTTRTIDNHIVQLRQKFAPEYFVTVHGVGYMFTVPRKNRHE